MYILEIIKKYIDNNNKRPSNHSNNNEIKSLGNWISQQLTYYPRKERIMKYKVIRKLWEEFINDTKYKQYF